MVLAGVWLMIIYGSVVSSIPVCNLELAFCHHHHNAATTGDSVQSSNQPMQTHFKEPKRATNWVIFLAKEASAYPLEEVNTRKKWQKKVKDDRKSNINCGGFSVAISGDLFPAQNRQWPQPDEDPDCSNAKSAHGPSLLRASIQWTSDTDFKSSPI